MRPGILAGAAERVQRQLARLGLDAGGQHARRGPARAFPGFAALENLDRAAGLRQPPADRQPDHAAADDGGLRLAARCFWPSMGSLRWHDPDRFRGYDLSRPMRRHPSRVQQIEALDAERGKGFIGALVADAANACQRPCRLIIFGHEPAREIPTRKPFPLEASARAGAAADPRPLCDARAAEAARVMQPRFTRRRTGRVMTGGFGISCSSGRSSTGRISRSGSPPAPSSEDPLFFAIVDKQRGALGMASFMRINPGHGVIELGNIFFAAPLAA